MKTIVCFAEYFKEFQWFLLFQSLPPLKRSTCQGVRKGEKKEQFYKNEQMDLYHYASSFTNSKIRELENDIERHVNEKSSIEAKLEEVSKEPSRKEIIEEFKNFGFLIS